MASPQPGRILFVVGMHRSGTSALCAALQACGAGFPPDLIEPQAGVNDLGFWESSRLVELNDRLLGELGAQWYSVVQEQLPRDWQSSRFDGIREEASEFLASLPPGLVACKDPRLCLTLQFWLAACRDLQLEHSVCIMHRPAAEVGLSLQRRDALPPAYVRHLMDTYLRSAVAVLPPDTLVASYDELLRDALGLMRRFAVQLPLDIDEALLRAAVRGDLRHYNPDSLDPCVNSMDGLRQIVADGLSLEECPPARVMAEMAEAVVCRGRELTRVGELHSAALLVVQERDASISDLDARLAEIGRQHHHAQEVVAERDRQLQEIQASQAALGEMHSEALAVIAQRDAQISSQGQEIQRLESLLNSVLHIPLVGAALRKWLNYAAR